MKDYILYSLIIGIISTIFMDLYSYTARKLFNISSLDYRLLGRWIIYFSKGKFFHNTIIQSYPMRFEKIIGWTAYYCIGIIFGFFLLLYCGLNWLNSPNIIAPLVIGISTIIAPWFIMQPAFGFGYAASKLPNPKLARWRSFITHLVYGIGLYFSAALISYFK